MSTKALVVKADVGAAELLRIGEKFPIYRSALNGFVSYLKGCEENPYRSFERFIEAARGYLAERKRRMSPSSLAVDAAAIKKAIRELAENHDLKSSEWLLVEKELKRIKPTRPATVAIGREKVLTAEEVRAVIEGATERIGLMVEFLYTTGTRINEALGIRPRDIIPTSNGHYAVRVLGKRSEHRDLKVSHDLLERIRKCFRGNRYLFETRGTSGKPYAYEYVTRQIRKVGERVLGKRISAHTLRHSFATRALQKTRKIKALSAYLGHSSTSVTLDMYVHEEFSQEDLDSVWEELREAPQG